MSPFSVNNEELSHEVRESLDQKIQLSKHGVRALEETVCYYIISTLLWEKIKEIVSKECDGCIVQAENQLGHVCIYLDSNYYLKEYSWFERFYDWKFEKAITLIDWVHVKEVYKLHSALFSRHAAAMCSTRHWRTRSRRTALKDDLLFYTKLHALSENSYIEFMTHLHSLIHKHQSKPKPIDVEAIIDSLFKK